MKKFFCLFSLLFILVLVEGCKLDLNSDNYGTVIVRFGDNSRKIGNNDLPILSGANIKVYILNENGEELGVGSNGFKLNVIIGTKITVKVKIIEPGAIWIGESECVVVKGDNYISVKLNKAPKIFPAFTYSIIQTYNSSSGGKRYKLTLQTETGTEIFSAALDEPEQPNFIRDHKGRIYIVYNHRRNFERLKADGSKDDSFSGISSFFPEFMAFDPVSKTVCVNSGSTFYFIKDDNAPNNSELPILASASSKAIAFYDSKLFIFYEESSTLKLSVYEVETGVTTAGDVSINSASLASINLIELQNSQITDAYADETGIYCLARNTSVPMGYDPAVESQPTLNNSSTEIYPMLSLGILQKFSFNGSTIEEKETYGLNGEKLTPTSIDNALVTFENLIIKGNDAKFYGPEKFVGKDEDGNLYIADNGFEAGIKNNLPKVITNKNRIAKFNPKTGSLSFQNANATWQSEWIAHKEPNTKILLWKEVSSYPVKMDFWLGDNGNEAKPEDFKLFLKSDNDNKYTDVFCYDTDGNFYILVKGKLSGGTSSGCSIKKYERDNNGGYKKTSTFELKDESATTIDESADITAIAVDSSNPAENRLYFYYENKILYHKFACWKNEVSEPNSIVFKDLSSMPFPEVTALVANKDGVFAAVRTEGGSYPNEFYKTSIYKYDKGGVERGNIEIAKTLKDTNNAKYAKVLVGDMQIIGNSLYVLYNKTIGANASDHIATKATIGGRILKVANITNDISKADTLWEKAPSEEGIAPYRFIAIKPKKLVIASDGFYGNKDATSQYEQRNKVLTFDLQNKLMSKQDAEAEFSKTLTFVSASGVFYW